MCACVFIVGEEYPPPSACNFPPISLSLIAPTVEKASIWDSTFNSASFGGSDDNGTDKVSKLRCVARVHVAGSSVTSGVASVQPYSDTANDTACDSPSDLADVTNVTWNYATMMYGTFSSRHVHISSYYCAHMPAASC